MSQISEGRRARRGARCGLSPHRPAVTMAIACGAAASVGIARGQTIEAYPIPTLDRWMYPFNATPGVRPIASTFAAPPDDGRFDDADAQFIVGFDTGALVPVGLGVGGYIVERASLRVWVANTSDYFVYDDTWDPVSSYYSPTDPRWTPDPDPGRPILLYGVGYRDGFTAATFEETTPFSALAFPTEERIRRAFAAAYSVTGEATDVSNFVKDGFEPEPWAIATTTAVSPG